jgi:hypothetical protein
MLSKAFGLITFTFINTVKEIKWQTYARINLKGKVKFWIKYQNMLLYRSRTSSFFERRRTLPNVHGHKRSRERPFTFNFSQERSFLFNSIQER